MTKKQELVLITIGLTIFNLAVIPWGLDQWFNGSNTARVYILISSIFTVPILLVTVALNIICLLSWVLPETAQTKAMSVGSPKKLKKALRFVENIIDIFD